MEEARRDAFAEHVLRVVNDAGLTVLRSILDHPIGVWLEGDPINVYDVLNRA
jgi:hypothetical protein